MPTAEARLVGVFAGHRLRLVVNTESCERAVVVDPAERPLSHRLQEGLARDRAVFRAGEHLLIRRRQVGGDLVEDPVRIAPDAVDERLQVRADRRIRPGR